MYKQGMNIILYILYRDCTAGGRGGADGRGGGGRRGGVRRCAPPTLTDARLNARPNATSAAVLGAVDSDW